MDVLIFVNEMINNDQVSKLLLQFYQLLL